MKITNQDKCSFSWALERSQGVLPVRVTDVCPCWLQLPCVRDSWLLRHSEQRERLRIVSERSRADSIRCFERYIVVHLDNLQSVMTYFTRKIYRRQFEHFAFKLHTNILRTSEQI